MVCMDTTAPFVVSSLPIAIRTFAFFPLYSLKSYANKKDLFQSGVTT